MGLDMYLYTNSRKLAKEVHEGQPYGEFCTDWYRKEGIVMYWRKANAIHKWFVENVQGGNDDCGTYEVYPEQLFELRDLCKRIVDECPLVDGKMCVGEKFEGGAWVKEYEDGKVISNWELADELLPTQRGFFFGSTDYDQWYYEDVKWTCEELDRILSMLQTVKDGWAEVLRMKGEPDWNVRFYYHSSW